MLIKNQKDLFSYIDPDFKNWEVNEGVKAPRRKLEVKIPDKNFTFKDVFTKKDALTQKEVIEFVKSHKKDFEHSHFFLLKNSKNKLFVAGVCLVSDGGLGVGVRRFEHSYVSCAEYRPRLVRPQLASPLTLDLEEAIKVVKEAGYKIIKEV